MTRRLTLPGGEMVEIVPCSTDPVRQKVLDWQILRPDRVDWTTVTEHVGNLRRGIVLPENYYRSEGQVRADQVFIATAFLMATRSTCTRGHVGAVAVQDRRIVATGYNGAPPGRPHCTDVGCDLSAGEAAGCQRSVHAEANLVAWAARAGVGLAGALVYSTHSPCKKCAELLLSAGIAEFHFSREYRLGEVGILTQAGIYTMNHGGATYQPNII